MLLVLATATLGAFGAVALLGRAVGAAPLSSVVPDEGHNAAVVGGIGVGGLTGLMLPVILFGMARGNEDTPRVGLGAAARKVLAVLVFDVWLPVVALLVAQLGWLLPAQVTTVVAVFAVGFGWMPLAMVPWERFGFGDGRSSSVLADAGPAQPPGAGRLRLPRDLTRGALFGHDRGFRFAATSSTQPNARIAAPIKGQTRTNIQIVYVVSRADTALSLWRNGSS